MRPACRQGCATPARAQRAPPLTALRDGRTSQHSRCQVSPETSLGHFI
ncbi:hypothetical protein BN2497_13679 [Janthinobacterium sp. CG23_2]|nr:hypothetical protein BN2497_13679 [Janthinobacterium sp. CG23_2]CUU33237.1 hypothetical protein BN3177_13679 [Janthinobacterium sp. CG23_2]